QADKLLEIKEQLTNVRQIVVFDMKGMRAYDDPWVMSFDTLLSKGEANRKATGDLIKNNLAQQDIDDVALMVYTSGSTGKPKGAMLTWRNISVAAASAIDANKFSSADSCVSYLPLCHVAEQLSTVTTGIGAGIQVNFGESLRTIQGDLREIAPTTFLAVPRIWEKMHSTVRVKLEEAGGFRRWLFNRAYAACEPYCEVARRDWSLGQRLKFLISYWLVFRALQNQLGLRRARILLSGAAPISPELLTFFRAIGLPVREAFGMTETAALGFMQNIEHYISGTVGFPLAMVEAKVAADGELLMRGPMVFKGYYRDPDATADALRDGWLYTGDLAEEIDGQFRIVGRKKEILITAGGKNLSPAEIENNLKVSAYIKEAIVCGDRKPYLTALIQIDYDNVANWAERQGLGFTNFRSLAESNEVRNLVDSEVLIANERVAQVAGVKKFVLLTKELDHDDNEMTATQKIRRNSIHDKYAGLIESLYQTAPTEPTTART
ncbi:MAG: AMP-binding protein, partial [Rhodospirillales bacterium]|nr:AMP-binding protein [Rhodospirillales bacterium]